MSENDPPKTQLEEQHCTIYIDHLIHEPARYNIIASLYSQDRADFFFMLRHTGLTWGNLSAHVAKLEKAGYVEIRKEILGKKLHTTATLTTKGRLAFNTYRKDMIQLLSSLPFSNNPGSTKNNPEPVRK